MVETLLSRVSHLKNNIEITSKAENDKSDLSSLKIRLEQFEKIANLASKICEFNADAEKALPSEFLTNLDLGQVRQVFQDFYDVYLLADRDIEALARSQVTEFTTNILPMLQQILTTQHADWVVFCESLITTSDTSSLDALKDLPGYRSRINRLKSMLETLQEKKKLIPSDLEETVSDLYELRSEYQKAWDEMEANDIHPSVLKFLKAVSSGTCTLLNVDQEVLNWLSDKNLSKNYWIKTY